jgi:hypothetical protein
MSDKIKYDEMRCNVYTELRFYWPQGCRGSSLLFGTRKIPSVRRLKVLAGDVAHI